MGRFGYKIGQADDIYDLQYELERGSLEKMLTDNLGYLQSLKGDYGDDLDTALFLCAMACRSWGMKITYDYYGNDGDPVWRMLALAKGYPVSKELVKSYANCLQDIMKYIGDNAKEYMEDEMDGESFYDAVGVGNRIQVTSMYDFYCCVIRELEEDFNIIEGMSKNSVERSIVQVYSGIGRDESGMKYSMYDVPEVDSRMIGTGFKDALLLTDNDGYQVYRAMLCTPVDGFDRETIEAMLSVQKLSVEYVNDGGTTADEIDYASIAGGEGDDISIDVSSNEDDTVYMYPLFDENGKASFGNKTLPKDEFYASGNITSRIVLKNLDEWTEKGILVDNMHFIVAGELFTDYDKLRSAKYFKGIGRMLNVDGDVITDDTYAVYYVMVVEDEYNPRTVGFLRWLITENDDILDSICEKYGYDKDDLSETLLNTPVDKEITIKGISDKQLLEWDRQRYEEKRGPFLRARF